MVPSPTVSAKATDSSHKVTWYESLDVVRLGKCDLDGKKRQSQAQFRCAKLETVIWNSECGIVVEWLFPILTSQFAAWSLPKEA